jgi:hypothetical protein
MIYVLVIHKTQNSLFFLVYVPAAAKPVYSTNTTYNATPRVVAQPKVQAPAQASSAATYTLVGLTQGFTANIGLFLHFWT